MSRQSTSRLHPWHIERSSILFIVAAAAAVVVIAQEAETEAPAGFTTPTIGQAIGPTGELIQNAGSQSISNGIAEPPGDTFALDQAQFERRHDPSTGLGPVFNATSCADCHQNGVTGAASQITEVRAGHRGPNGIFVNPGEAQGVIRYFKELTPTEQQELIAFLKSLYKELLAAVRAARGVNDMSVMNLDTIRLALEAKRKELLSGGSDRNEILIETVADEFDRMQQQLNREVALTNLDREARLLKDVQAAIARLADGTFGMCLHCEEEIPAKRLKAIPWAAHCVACQERIDEHRLTGEAEEAKGTSKVAA